MRTALSVGLAAALSLGAAPASARDVPAADAARQVLSVHLDALADRLPDAAAAQLAGLVASPGLARTMTSDRDDRDAVASRLVVVSDGPDGVQVATLPLADRSQLPLAEQLVEQAAGTDASPDLEVTVSGDPLQDQQWALPKLRSPQSWQTSVGTGKVVAVLDTGVEVSHPDLHGRTVAGYDTYRDQPGGTSDTNGHGTHVAGIVAAGRNGVGIVGQAPDAKIMPVNVFRDTDADGSTGAAWSDVLEGVAWATTNGADVINLSLGVGSSYKPAGQAIFDAAADAGVVVVAAAGNDGTVAPTNYWPAGFDGVVGVAATTTDDTRAVFSSVGSWVDVAAPGVSIASAYPGGRWALMSGTSMATPYVAGLAAQLQAARPTLTAPQVAEALTTSAVDLGPVGYDTSFGAGRIDAPGALAWLPVMPSPEPEPSPEPSPEPEPSPAPGPGRGHKPSETFEKACPTGAVYDMPFSDVAGVHARAVGCVAARGITAGTSPSAFTPAAAVTRAQMATFLARTIDNAGGQLSGGHVAFTDVSGVHADAIGRLAHAGIISGVTPATYRPDAPVTRAQMASLLARTYTYLGEPAAAPTPPFTDLGTSPHNDAIAAVAHLGIAAGTSSSTFEPGRPVSREQMATFLVRSLGALELDGFVATD